MTRPTTAADIFTQLKAPFPSTAIEWKLGGTNKDGTKGRALPYLKFQAVADRLDEVLGETNWTNTYVSGPAGGVVCRLALRIENEWLTKENGAANTDKEGIKGGLSDAFKRAATMFGVGRYLHSYSSILVDVENGRWVAPALPDEFLPAAEVEQRRKDYEAYEADVAAGRIVPAVAPEGQGTADDAPAADAATEQAPVALSTPEAPATEEKAESAAKTTRSRSTSKATLTETTPPAAAEAVEQSAPETSAAPAAPAAPDAKVTPTAAESAAPVAEPAAPASAVEPETAAAPEADKAGETVVELPAEQPAAVEGPVTFILDDKGYPLVPEGLPESDVKLLGSLVTRVSKAEQLDPVRDYLENGKGRTALSATARQYLFAYVDREEAIRKEAAAAA
jgi:hypothetical protein